MTKSKDCKFLQKLSTIDDVTKYRGTLRYIIVVHFLIPRIPTKYAVTLQIAGDIVAPAESVSVHGRRLRDCDAASSQFSRSKLTAETEEMTPSE